MVYPLIKDGLIYLLVASRKELSISHLNEPGPHREIALIVRENYAGIESAMLLLEFFKRSLKKNS